MLTDVLVLFIISYYLSTIILFLIFCRSESSNGDVTRDLSLVMEKLGIKDSNEHNPEEKWVPIGCFDNYVARKYSKFFYEWKCHPNLAISIQIWDVWF